MLHYTYMIYQSFGVTLLSVWMKYRYFLSLYYPLPSLNCNTIVYNNYIHWEPHYPCYNFCFSHQTQFRELKRRPNISLWVANNRFPKAYLTNFCQRCLVVPVQHTVPWKQVCWRWLGRTLITKDPFALLQLICASIANIIKAIVIIETNMVH